MDPVAEPSLASAPTAPRPSSGDAEAQLRDVEFHGEVVVSTFSWRAAAWPMIGCAAVPAAALLGFVLGGVWALGLSGLAAWYLLLHVLARIGD